MDHLLSQKGADRDKVKARRERKRLDKKKRREKAEGKVKNKKLEMGEYCLESDKEDKENKEDEKIINVG